MTKNKTTRTDKPFKIVTVGSSELSKSVELIKKATKTQITAKKYSSKYYVNQFMIHRRNKTKL